MMNADKKLFISLFVVQVLASFLVVVGHFTASANAIVPATEWETSLNQISRYGTVLLAILTGFFTAHSFAVKKTKGKTFFAGKLKYIFIPFLLSGVLYHMLLLGHAPGSKEEILSILLGNTGGHLYFVFMLCQYYLFAYACRNIITRKNILSFLAIFLVIQYVYIKMNHDLFGLGIRHFLPTWIFTIYCGHALYAYRQEIIGFIKNNKLVWFLLFVLGGGSAAYFVEAEKMYTANHIPFVISTFCLLLTVIVPFTQFVYKLPVRFQKGMTFYVYLLHSAVIIYFNRFFIKELNWEWLLLNKWYSFAYMTLIWMVTLFIALCITSMLKGMPKIGANIFSTRREGKILLTKE